MSDYFFTKRVLSFPCQDLREPERMLRNAYATNPSADLWGIWQGGVWPCSKSAHCHECAHRTLRWLDAFDGCDVESVWVLEPTARPRSVTPLARSGVYVFRDFWLPYQHVAEAVELSSAA